MSVTKGHERPGRGCTCCPDDLPKKEIRWARRTAKQETRKIAKEEGKR